MRYAFIIIMLSLLSCTNVEKEKQLNAKADELNRLEQELKVREASLNLKEEQLQERERLLRDSLTKSEAPAFVDGNWNATLNCTEAGCQGYAVGDVKKEQWSISRQGKLILANVSVADKLVRSYSGSFEQNRLELSDSQATGDTRMVVRLELAADSAKLQGQREILRPDCKVVFSVLLEKQK